MAIVGRAKYTRARENSRRLDAKGARRVSSNFRARVCISRAPQSPSPELETTRSLLGIDRIRVLWGNFLREILRSRPRVHRHISSQITTVMGSPFSEGAFFSKLKFRVFCCS